MARINCLKTGLIYKNPIPHVYSRHACHPSIARLQNGELLSAVIIGQAFEAPDSRVHLFRSMDNGETWHHEGLMIDGTITGKSDFGKVSATEKGEVIGLYVLHNRTLENEGYTNHRNMGLVEMELMITRSSDKGHTWTKPLAIEPPLVGPAFEPQSAIIFFKNGKWILPTSTWRGWDGCCPNGMKAVAFVSYDKGRTWPEYMDVMNDTKNGIIFWESNIIELADGRLLATAWGYDEKNNIDLPNQYAVSADGNIFGEIKSTGLIGQTMTTILLDDGRILSLYRRMDKSGLWANISRLEGDAWVNEDELPLWGSDTDGLVSKGKNMANNFTKLRFGAPRMIKLDDGVIFAAFWCYEDYQGVIRWFKLKVNT